jgi:F-type H+-transporting ATPase subunit b
VQIDLFTVAAQIINFLILVWLLKRFLYDRIVSAMDERQRTIESRLEDARKEKERAEKKADELEEKRRELESRREEILREAREDAEERRRELAEEARAEVGRKKERWKRAMTEERDTFLSRLREAASRETYATVRKVLRELADADIGSRAVDLFIERLGEAEEDTIESFRDAATAEGGGLTVVSGSELSEESTKKIEQAVRERLGDAVDVAFDTSEALILGIELRSGGQKLGMTAGGYLDELEKRLRARLDEQAGEAGDGDDAGNRGEREDAERGDAGDESG